MVIVDGVGDFWIWIGAGDVAEEVDSGGELAYWGLGLGVGMGTVVGENFMCPFCRLLESLFLIEGIAFRLACEPEVAKNSFVGLGGGDPGWEFIRPIWCLRGVEGE